MTAPVSPRPPGIRRTAIAAGAFACVMVGVAFAAVPLYTLFCQVTGFGGTPLRSDSAANAVIDRVMTVRFDTNVAPGIGWRFVPDVAKIEARVGETQTVFFRVTNPGRAASVGVSTFNVEPAQAAGHFVKMQCFCFNEQTLQPGETMDFPVVFYIDPAIAKDRNLDGIREITLSYTYFPSKNGMPVEARAAAATGSVK